MKKTIFTLSLALSILLSGLHSQAQGMAEKDNPFSVSASADASMFQIALLNNGGQSELSTLRFSYFFNSGTHLNYKINDGLTFFSGLSLKNLGIIVKGDTTRKYRVYSLGVPLGLKIKTGEKQYVIVGGGVDFPFNYKAKSWADGRKNKTKSSEWFSDKVNPIMPYVQLGYRMKSSIVAKVLYYPTNFWDADHPINNGREGNIIALTLGFDIGRKTSKGMEIKLPKKKKTQ